MFKANANKNQLQAITSKEKYIKVIAGAGSGKTFVLTSRIIQLINDGTNPDNILAITFTNKASKEMKDRIVSKINDENIPKIFTFHSFCAYFLRREINNSHLSINNSFNIYDDEDKTSLIKQIFKELNINSNLYDNREINNYISYRKTNYYNKTFFLNSYYGEKGEVQENIYHHYQTKLQEMNSLDFDDLLIYTYQILIKDNKVLSKWQNMFTHILVDEFQDTNDIQFDLIKLLLGKENSLFVVGDPDQTIYTWRGANYKIINDLEKYYFPLETIILNQNYRSSKNILDIANNLIKHNVQRDEKELVTLKKGEEVVYFNFSKREEEASFIAKQINYLVNVKKIPLKEIAILYRANYLSREIEKALIRNNINYQIYGGVNFYQRKEIKDVLAYLKILNNPKDDISLLRIINEPKRSIGNTTISYFENIAVKENISLLDSIKDNIDTLKSGKTKDSLIEFLDSIKHYSKLVNKISLSVLVEQMLESVGYYAYLEEKKEIERIENIKELVNEILKLEEIYEKVDLVEFLQEINLYTSQDELSSGEHVSLMTIHIAKGLEYRVVFVSSLCEGIFPNSKSINESKEGIEEERRLAYVAFTRAKDYLILTSNTDFSFVINTYNKISRFIKEALEDQKDIYQPYQPMGSQTPFKKTMIAQNYENYSNNEIKWEVNDVLEHENFGEGIVLKVDNNIIEVAFKQARIGKKTLLGNHKSLRKL